ncbi:type IV toxin-antitoxin system AbiEi family antitoxin domain-containing protein [Kribbella sandramycini]|nr:type IV toxin-antitoxin system AbiEi family antitoxin domain-containing protein [Kribbella sandramycini]
MAAIRGGVFTRADARACGYHEADIDYLLRSGGWWRVRHGKYAVHRLLSVVTEEDAYVRRVAAVLRAGGPAILASHQSAAVLHGLPAWGLDLTTVHVTSPCNSGSPPGVHRHIRDPVGPGVLTWNKLRMVSPARAVAEVAATAESVPAIALIDAALYSGLVTPRTATRAISLLPHGADRAAHRLTLHTGAASVAETRLRLILAKAGLPSPIPPPPSDPEQPTGGILWFPAERALVEFELRHPYWREEYETDEPVEPAPTPSDPPFPVETCWLSWADLDRPQLVVDRIRTTFTLARRRSGVRHFPLARA